MTCNHRVVTGQRQMSQWPRQKRRPKLSQMISPGITETKRRYVAVILACRNLLLPINQNGCRSSPRSSLSYSHAKKSPENWRGLPSGNHRLNFLAPEESILAFDVASAATNTTSPSINNYTVYLSSIPFPLPRISFTKKWN
jgi:hypothetical protein